MTLGIGAVECQRCTWIASAAMLLASAVACGRAAATVSGGANVSKGCIEKYDPAIDYFPEKVTIEDAVKFSVDYHRSYKVVTVRGTENQPERYVLVQCGTPPPQLAGDLLGAQIVSLPVTSLYSASPTHLPLLVDLGRLDVLTGVSQRTQLTGEEILKWAASGHVLEFGSLAAIDVELVISQQPSVLMTGGATSTAHAAIRSAGIPVVANNEWMEPTALARAEWLKYMALFLNEEGDGQRLYLEMKGRYEALRNQASAVPEDRKPTVMTGRGTRGDFVIAGGRSYVAALIKDAGGRYVWADSTAAGQATVDLETQIRRAANADIWINGGGWPSLAAIVKDEPRYGEFKAYRTGQVWVYERKLTATGGNDYWSRSVSHPDLLLADLVKILHPSLVSQHEFQWYLQVPAR